MPQKTLVALVITEDKEILLFEKNNQLIFPGGEPKGGESDEETLEREFKKEASGAEIKVGERYGIFLGLTPDEKDSLETFAYLAKLKKSYSKLIPSAAINKIWLLKYENIPFSYLPKIIKKIITDLNNEERL